MVWKKGILFCALLILLAQGKAFSGAWTMKKGHMYNRFVFNYYETDRFYDEHGDSHDMPLDGRFYDRNLNWYQEYGLTDRLTLITSLYYKWLSYHDDYIHDRSHGPGDAEIGLKYKLYEGAFVLSLQGLFKYGKLYGHESPEIGNRQNDYEVRLLLGKSLWPFPGYCGLEVGYRFRAGDPADEVRYLAEFGMNFTQRFYGRVKLDGVWGMGNADIEKPYRPRTPTNPSLNLEDLFSSGVNPPQARLPEESEALLSNLEGLTNPRIAPEYNLIKLDLTFGYQLTEKLGLEFEYTPTLYGENISKGATTAVAITYSW